LDIPGRKMTAIMKHRRDFIHHPRPQPPGQASLIGSKAVYFLCVGYFRPTPPCVSGTGFGAGKKKK